MRKVMRIQLYLKIVMIYSVIAEFLLNMKYLEKRRQ